MLNPSQIVYERPIPEPPRYIIAVERTMTNYGGNSPQPKRTYWEPLEEHKHLGEALRVLKGISRYDRRRYAIFDRKKKRND